ncbi:MAG: hypothetical protein Faunusvirus2_38 [Faunusvirus sp.]|jgi:ankyrin repeat protein|uniref:Uncharacterized protein n=1 Tax=Faunusvirus sp. TaxID=2487766 RepID=A0A3G4ZYL4_9VIRU|nr:MAG: hypothetical protein Faunusvirus2_38 [Faunusvirus sp.]
MVEFKSNINVIAELVRKGANVNYETPGGNTPLKSACFNKYEDMAIMLIKMGAHFADIIDTHIVKYNNHKVIIYLRDLYQQRIKSVINDDTGDNALAVSFRTTYVSGIVDIVSEFII